MASAACGCSNISIMQLFHQLKQDFPAAPDEVVMQCIWQHAHDKEACERALQGLDGAFLVHTYPSALTALMTGATRMPMPGAMGRPMPGQGPVAGAAPNHVVVAAPGHGKGHAKGLGTEALGGDHPSSAEARGLHRPPRKMRPAPPPPVQAAVTPPQTPPPRLRPAPPPPPGPPSPSRVNGPSDQVTVLDVNCSVSRGAPPPGTPPGPPPGPPLGSPAPPRRMTTMDIQPAAPFGVGVVPPRSYTSVNLTLRPPAADQPPIDIHSGRDSGGSSLTYSTSSYDQRQGYQSQLQIRIGPNGLGSVSAMRTRAPAPPAVAPPAAPVVATPAPAPRPPPRRLMSPLAEVEEQLRRPAASREDLERAVMAMGGAQLSPDMREHLVRQLERRTLLETELEKERFKLQMMQREVLEMERDLERRTAQVRPRAPPALPVMEKVQRLRTEIQTLQEVCTRMTNEVDAKSPDSRPAEGSSAEPGWTCQTCTFRNHYLLEVCEECDVPRIRLGSESAGAQSVFSVPAGLHALRLPGILPALASPALESALAPLSLSSSPSALCVPNMLTPLPSPGRED
ncbi:atrophin-1 isoform X2 [Frankliniella occidentalis]|uniref:Atrophin-1 isoform X2 n=1 Tax=Frankliniella occidentalis TaxID=133901 RepID=A0A9C6WYW7_FRAOC|nr:atrophin-1 isoform X2 [Frankliniella occidentalis]